MEGLLQTGGQDSCTEGKAQVSVQVIVTVQLPDELYQKLAAVAKAQQVSVSVLAGKMITDYVNEERWKDGKVQSG